MKREDSRLARWPSLYRDVSPLPGGLDALRANIARPVRPRLAWRGGVAAAVCAAALTIYWYRPDPTPRPDATATLLAGSLPHPDAVALGIADRPQLADIPDPRLAERRDEVVFRWVVARPGELSVPRGRWDNTDDRDLSGDTDRDRDARPSPR